MAKFTYLHWVHLFDHLPPGRVLWLLHFRSARTSGDRHSVAVKSLILPFDSWPFERRPPELVADSFERFAPGHWQYIPWRLTRKMAFSPFSLSDDRLFLSDVSAPVIPNTG